MADNTDNIEDSGPEWDPIDMSTLSAERMSDTARKVGESTQTPERREIAVTSFLTRHVAFKAAFGYRSTQLPDEFCNTSTLSVFRKLGYTITNNNDKTYITW